MLMVPGANWWLAAQQNTNVSQKLSLNSNLINTSVVTLTSSETLVPSSETVKLTSLPINTSSIIDVETSPSLTSATLKEEEEEILPICPEEPPGLQVRELYYN